MKRYGFLCLAVLLPVCSLTGCAALVRTPYQRPSVNLPAAWSQHNEGAIPVDDRWWEGFGDPTLNRLVAEALQRNNDLAAATLRVRKAQLQAELAGSGRLPDFSVQGNGEISRYLGSGNKEIRNISASAAVSYELDLWGKLAQAHDAARWEAMATEEDRAGTVLSLVGTTASFYWQIGSLNQRIRQAEASIEYAKRTLELVRVEKTAGAASNLEVLEAQRSLANQEAHLTTLLQQRVEARNNLALLFDGPPQSLKTSEPQDLLVVPIPELGAELPAHLLARRPDLRAAEARLRAALANTDATRASFYPAINLRGQLGGSSEQLSRFLSNPLATLGADLTLPFIQWQDMRRNVKISETEYEQAVITFRQTLYNALADVENSLSARYQYRMQGEKLEQALAAARQTEELYRIRYQAGGSPLKLWLDAQENRRQAEIALAENRLSQLQTHITLAKAVAGAPGSDPNATPAGK